MSGAGDITLLLQKASAGDRRANSDLFETVYRELRLIANAHRRRWSGNETLSATALINEAYIRLANQTMSRYRDRSHFFATASKAMRQILINYAERYSAAKRGGDQVRVTLAGLSFEDDQALEELVHIDALLNQLEESNPRQCRIFECRVFGGMTIDETSEAVDVSPATVKRDWTVVSAWIFSELGSGMIVADEENQ